MAGGAALVRPGPVTTQAQELPPARLLFRIEDVCGLVPLPPLSFAACPGYLVLFSLALVSTRVGHLRLSRPAVENRSGTRNLAFRYPAAESTGLQKYTQWPGAVFCPVLSPYLPCFCTASGQNRRDGACDPVDSWQWQKRRHLRRSPSRTSIPACRRPAVVDLPRRPRFENGWWTTRSVRISLSVDDVSLALLDLFYLGTAVCVLTQL